MREKEENPRHTQMGKTQGGKKETAPSLNREKKVSRVVRTIPTFFSSLLVKVGPNLFIVLREGLFQRRLRQILPSRASRLFFCKGSDEEQHSLVGPHAARESHSSAVSLFPSGPEERGEKRPSTKWVGLGRGRHRKLSSGRRLRPPPYRGKGPIERFHLTNTHT